MPPKLGVIAGGGPLPVRIIESCRRQGRPVHVIALKDQADPADYAGVEHTVMRVGAAGTTIRKLREAGCTQVVLAGWVRRPSVLSLCPDWWVIRFLVVRGAFSKGDDGLLSALIRAIEAEGLEVVGADGLVPELLMPMGVLGTIQPPAEAKPDIDAALAAARDLGARDLGQAAVTHDGGIVAEETKDGTDAMLRRLAATGNKGGILAKTLKPEQERRVDLPAFGAATVENAAKAGLSGIVVEAGNAFLMDAEATRKAADDAGLFVVGVAPGGTWP